MVSPPSSPTPAAAAAGTGGSTLSPLAAPFVVPSTTGATATTTLSPLEVPFFAPTTPGATTNPEPASPAAPSPVDTTATVPAPTTTGPASTTVAGSAPPSTGTLPAAPPHPGAASLPPSSAPATTTLAELLALLDQAHQTLLSAAAASAEARAQHALAEGRVAALCAAHNQASAQQAAWGGALSEAAEIAAGGDREAGEVSESQRATDAAASGSRLAWTCELEQQFRAQVLAAEETVGVALGSLTALEEAAGAVWQEDTGGWIVGGNLGGSSLAAGLGGSSAGQSLPGGPGVGRSSGGGPATGGPSSSSGGPATGESASGEVAAAGSPEKKWWEGEEDWTDDDVFYPGPSRRR